MVCPGFALFLVPLLSKRAREGRAPASARDPWAKMHTGWSRGSRISPTFPRDGLNNVYVLCLVSDRHLWIAGGTKSPIESMLSPQGPTPESQASGARLLRCSDRSLLLTDIRPRVCSPSKLPRRRFTAPVVLCVPELSASIASCPAIPDDSRVAALIGQDASPIPQSRISIKRNVFAERA